VAGGNRIRRRRGSNLTRGKRTLVGIPLLLLTAAMSRSGTGTAVFAGGCFWGVGSVFEHLRGVQSVTAGYAEGLIEAVRVVYDPAQISHRELLQVFFGIAHDPTLRDRQGPDVGPEYRAVAYYLDEEQRRGTLDYKAELERAHVFPRPIVTEVQPLHRFRIAEPVQQDYAARHPDDPYIVVNDAPKLERLRRDFPTLYRAERGARPAQSTLGMVHYPLRLVYLRILADTAYGLQLLAEPRGVGGSGKEPSVVWLRFDPEAALAWLNSAAGALRAPVALGPPEALQWSPPLRPLDGRGGFLLGRHRKKGVLQKDHWLAIADSAPGWQAEITAQEADSLLRLFLVLASRSRIDSSDSAVPDKEHVDRPALLKEQSKAPRGLSGRVAAQFVVGVDGRVEEESLAVLMASTPDLVTRAAGLIRAWRFEPAQRGGVAVRQLVQQVITWR
jgi:peptide-methionine (S)-S-oxide reductase